jgi:carotenoid cleavage dioxygenase
MTVTDGNPSAATNVYVADNLAPVTEEVEAFDLTFTGTIPAELEGRWLRNGPNPLGPIDHETHHWFTGDGMVHGLRLRGGKAEWYRNRWVRSDKIAQALGEPTIDGPVSDFETGPNTNVIGFADKTWAIVEAGGSPVELDYNLNSVSRNNFEGTLAHGFSAHPKWDPKTNELHAACYSPMKFLDHIEYVVVGPDGRVSKTVDIEVPDGPMVHDMSITESSAIFYDLPVTFDFDLLTGGYFPYSWNNDHQARVGVMPRTGTAEDLVWYEVEPCYVFHPMNAYDTDDGKIVIDLSRHGSMFNGDKNGPFGEGGAESGLDATLDRWTIDPASGKVSEQRLHDRGQEFPRHNMKYGGSYYRYGYCATVNPGGNPLSGPTLKHDLEAGTCEEFDFGPNRGGAEPVFVARQDAKTEDDGWLMVMVYDAAENSSDMVIIDAADFGAGEVARIPMPQRVPEGFHGNWVPDRQVGEG